MQAVQEPVAGDRAARGGGGLPGIEPTERLGGRTRAATSMEDILRGGVQLE